MVVTENGWGARKGAGRRALPQRNSTAHLAVARGHTGLFLLAGFTALASLLGGIAKSLACAARAHDLGATAQHCSRRQ